MAVMTRQSERAEREGPPRLARPPSDRYIGESTEEAAAADAAATDAGASPARGIAYGVVAAIIGALVILFLGGVMTLSAGLLVVAAVAGRAVGQATAVGSGTTIEPRPRRWAAASLAVGGVIFGQVAMWLFARTEGGVLTLPDYLGQTFGILVPAQVVLAAIVAWWSAR